ncbi:mobilization protein [Escherichia coli]|uniref:mobilization protein n=1 Tax=Escherichia coli TaxID=562 RepID=UPI001FF30C19|nr:mobilization protein [Escherichia coli]
MAKSRAEKLEELRQKEAQIKAQIQQLKQREQTEERKKDTRRKILIGGAVLAKIKRGEWNYHQLVSLLDNELKNDRDRALFDEMGLKAVDTRKESFNPGNK